MLDPPEADSYPPAKLFDVHQLEVTEHNSDNYYMSSSGNMKAKGGYCTEIYGTAVYIKIQKYVPFDLIYKRALPAG